MNQYAGSSSNEKRTGFWGSHRRFRQVRTLESVRQYEYMPVMGLFSLLMLFLLEVTSNWSLPGVAAGVNWFVAFISFAFIPISRISQDPLPWREALFFMGFTILLSASLYGHSLLNIWCILALLGIVPSFIGWTAWAVNKAVWEPLAVALCLTLINCILIFSRIHNKSFFLIGVVIAIFVIAFLGIKLVINKVQYENMLDEHSE